jgi:uncharacterized protein YkwD
MQLPFRKARKRRDFRLWPMKRWQRVASVVILAGLVLATAGVLGVGQTTSSLPVNTVDKTLDRALLVQINVVRGANALRPLKISRGLSVAAAQHTTEMGQAGYFAHASLDDTPFWKRIERSYTSFRFRSWDVGENLLYVAPDVGGSKAMDLWMNSPKHRAILLDPAWREVGIATRHFSSAPGIYSNKAVTILTTDFGVRR